MRRLLLILMIFSTYCRHQKPPTAKSEIASFILPTLSTSCLIHYDFLPLSSFNSHHQSQQHSPVLDFVTFSKCELILCTLQGISEEGSTKCLSFDRYELPETNCMRKCCNNFAASKLNFETLNKCIQNDQNSFGSSNTLLIGLICGGLGGLVLTVILGICIYRKCHQEKISSGRNNDHNPEQPHFSHAILSQSEKRIKTDMEEQKERKEESMKLKWQGIKNGESEWNSTQTCAICMQSGLNCMISCGHKFHDRCLGNWMMKGDECPLCKQRILQNLRIACGICLLKTTTVTANKLKNYQTRHIQGQAIICSECSESCAHYQQKALQMEGSENI